MELENLLKDEAKRLGRVKDPHERAVEANSIVRMLDPRANGSPVLSFYELRAAAIRELRSVHGLSQAEVADMLQLTKSRVAQIESGQRVQRR